MCVLREIHALIGENGAGNQTLMRILSGACNSDCGEIVINGRPASIKSPMDSVKLGVAVIYQEYALATDLTVRIFSRQYYNWRKNC